MASDWKQVSLGEIVNFTPKRTIKKGTTAPFISMADVTENSKFIKEVFEKEYTGGGSRFANGDTLFARITPCLQNGKCSKVSGMESTEIGHGSTEFIVMAAKTPEYDEDYIYYLARLPKFRVYAESRMIGSTGRQRVSWQDLEEYEFAAPAPNERKHIGSILSSLDDKIELNRQMNETLEAMAQTLFKSWFVDFDPVIDNALEAGNTIPDEFIERAEQRKSIEKKDHSDIQALFPDEFEFTEEMGWIPKGWVVGSFSEFAELDTTSVKPNSEPEKIWEHFSIPSFDINTSPVFDTGESVKSNKYKVNPNAVLVSKLNPETERIWWVNIQDDDSAVCSTEFMQFIPKNFNHRAFIYSLLRSEYFRAEILSRVTGSTGSHQRTQPKSVAVINVLKPTAGLVSKFSQIALDWKVRVSENIEQDAILAKLRDTLLPKLMSGELRILDAKALVDEAV